MVSKKANPDVPEEPMSGDAPTPGFAEKPASFDGRPPAFHEEGAKLRGLTEIERLRATVERGLPFALVKDELAEIGLTFDLLREHDLIPEGKYRQHTNTDIVPPNDLRRLLRIVRVFRRARATIGSASSVLRWLSHPFDEDSDLDGATGAQLLLSEEGGAMLIERLDAIDHGFAA